MAYIDPENKFAIEDKLSQINTLEQLSNIASYGFLKKRLETHDLHVNIVQCPSLTQNFKFFFHFRFMHYGSISTQAIFITLVEAQSALLL